MKTRYVIVLTTFAAALAATFPLTSQAKPPGGGILRTMPLGTYQCALPGDAAGKAFVVVDEEQFRIGTASSYNSAEGAGVYILRGEVLTFTRGPKKGERFERVGRNQLQRLKPDGTRDKLLCTRLSGSA